MQARLENHQPRHGLAVKPEGQRQRHTSRATVVARCSSRGSPATLSPSGTTGELIGYESFTALRLATPQNPIQVGELAQGRSERAVYETGCAINALMPRSVRLSENGSLLP
jgi:hypothetical protein